jgi:glucose/arabinose dehydrogenase
MKNLRSLLILLFFLPLAAKDFSYSYPVKLTQLAQVKGIVWGFDIFDDNSIVMTQKRGILSLLKTDGSLSQITYRLPVVLYGQGGLLDVAVLNSRTKEILLTYTVKDDPNFTVALARGRLEGSSLVDTREIYRSNAYNKGKHHFGSRIAIDKNAGYIYMTVGDRSERDKAQSLKWDNGKTLRLTLEGDPAPGNPFENQAGARKEIWSLGHRNAQGIYLDAKGTLWEAEFGPKGGDEINIIEKGKNYGWPIATYGTEYNGKHIAPHYVNGTEEPVSWFVPSISPSGMLVYEGAMFPDWQGDIFLANLSSKHLRRVRITKKTRVQEEELFAAEGWRVRQVRTDKAGAIYFSTDEGGLFKVTLKQK